MATLKTDLGGTPLGKEPRFQAILAPKPKFRGSQVRGELASALVGYHKDSQKDSAYLEIHQIVSSNIELLKNALPDRGNPIVVMAHSLGAHIMSNYIWDHQDGNVTAKDFEPLDSVAAMITFGCNIPLFSLSFAKATPIDLPGKAITKAELAAASRWLNFVDRDDVLGWPLKPLYAMSEAKLTAKEQQTVDRIEDYEINAGGFLTSWNPASHARACLQIRKRAKTLNKNACRESKLSF